MNLNQCIYTVVVSCPPPIRNLRVDNRIFSIGEVFPMDGLKNKTEVAADLFPPRLIRRSIEISQYYDSSDTDQWKI